MRPYPEEVLRALQGGIMAHFAPEVQSGYAKAQLMFAMMLFGVVQRDYDTAVPDLVDANASMRGLLNGATEALGDLADAPATSARHAIAALPPKAASLRLSELRAEYEALRGALAALAPAIEPAADREELAPLRDLRARVFNLLLADARKRTVPFLNA